MKRAIVLDKDGTLIEDLPYNVDPRRIRLAPGAREAIRTWAQQGWPIAIATNQSGVARGYFTLEELDEVGHHLEGVIAGLGGTWGGFFACPHLPDGINEYAVECDCRKPAPGLIRQAVERLGVRPEDSWFIGDAWMDMAAGRAAGCRTILVGREWRRAASYPRDATPDHAVPDLAAAARITLGVGTVSTGAGDAHEDPKAVAS
jgi:D-glycero-D-manno-heptose 1,7-bisphosphate phosphatase